MKKNVFILFLLISGVVFSQDLTTFKRQKDFYLNGDATVIGNNILNKDATRAFNNSRVQNNDVRMRYVDIDKDNSTFSSSASILTLPNDIQNIEYAALYWSGTYPYNEGNKQRVGREYKFKKTDSLKDSNFNIIKLKVPNSSYKNITGKVIFNGAESKKHTENAPYVCYADVTNILKFAKTKNGLYTVANVRASVGFIPGGSSAGWMLYVVYKSPTKYPKYISTYSGFKYVANKRPVSIKFKNHESSINVDDVKTSIVIAAMEGDATLNGDECAIYNPKKGIHHQLSSGYRRKNNFFTSTISTSGLKSLDRSPGSRNTLGYDLIELDLPNNKDETIIKKNNNTILRFKTASDEFFVFFTAFKTEILEEINVNTNVPEVAVVAIEDNSNGQGNVKGNNTTIASPKSTKKLDNKIVKNKKTLNKTLFGRLTLETKQKVFNEYAKQKSIIITDLRSGYYIVSNIVNNENESRNWIKKLREEGFRGRQFKMPNKNLRYVYTFVSEDLNKVLDELIALHKNQKFKKATILKVNME